MGIFHVVCLIAALSVQSSLSACDENQIPVVSNCGGYCLNAVNPMLEQVKMLKENIHQCNAMQESSLEKFGAVQLQLLEKFFEPKLQTLQQQIDQNILAMIEDFKKQLDAQKAKPESNREEPQVEEEKLDEVSRNLSDSLKSQIDTLDSKLKARIDILDSSYKSQIDNATRSITNSLDKLKSESLKRKTTPDKVFTKIGSKYYYIAHSERVNWFQAAHKCIALGAHLVSILSDDELNGILPHLHAHLSYWIDLNDLGTEGEFYSLTTGLPASYAPWGSNPPNNAQNRENCCDLWWDDGRHKFNDNYCMWDDKAYICESD